YYKLVSFINIALVKSMRDLIDILSVPELWILKWVRVVCVLLTVTLPENGIYYLLANTFEAGESGSYNLRATISQQ
ncbi:MAG: hypothetical protein ACYT04_76295, partial [Nostoc sp.]